MYKKIKEERSDEIKNQEKLKMQTNAEQ